MQQYSGCPIIRTDSLHIIEEAKHDPRAILVNIGEEYSEENKIYDFKTSPQNPYPSIATIIWNVLKKRASPREESYITPFVRGIDSVIYSPDMLELRTVASVFYRCNDLSLWRYSAFDYTFDFLVDAVENGLSGIIAGPEALEELERRLVRNPILDQWNRNYSDYMESSSERISRAAKFTGPIVILDRPEPRLSFEIYYLPENKTSCVYPLGPDHWIVQQIPITLNTEVVRKYLPSEWAGLNGDALSSVVGIPGCTFCSTAGTIIGATSKEGAEQIALLADMIAN
jgi:hypothetical protein